MIVVILGAAAGGAVAAFVANPPTRDEAAAPDGTLQAELADRLAALEAALVEETERRAAVEAELAVLADRLEAASARGPDTGRESAVGRVTMGDAPSRFEARIAELEQRDSPEYRQSS